MKNNSLVCIILVLSMLLLPMITAADSIGHMDSSFVSFETNVKNKVSKSLLEQVGTSDSEKTIPVIVWFEDVDLSGSETAAVNAVGMTSAEWNSYIESDEISFNMVNQYIQSKRTSASSLYEDYNTQNASLYFREEQVIYCSRYSPVVICQMTIDEIYEAAQTSAINSLDYYCNDDAVQMSTAMQVTRTSNVIDSSSYGYTGEGVKIGVYEISLPSASFDNLNYTLYPYGYVGEDSAHADNVIDIISSIAPDAEYFFVSNTAFGANYIQEIEWMLDQGVNIINASRTIGGQYTYNQYNSTSKWIDHIAYNHDVHFVAASGNTGLSQVTPEAIAYNVITVGGIDDNRTLSYSDDVIASFSSFSGTTTSVQKPDLCAPAVGLVTDYSHLFEYQVFNGTSAAAPQVAGTIALLCEQRPELLTRQDAVKAILTASVNFSSPHRYLPQGENWREGYRRFGSGILDSLGACWVTSAYRYAMSSIGENTASKTHSFSVSNPGERIRVSLAYLIYSNYGSSSDHGNESALLTRNLANLDLEVLDPRGASVGTSSTEHNNVEIVEFEAELTGTYTIVVTRDTESDDNPTGSVFYGLAWR